MTTLSDKQSPLMLIVAGVNGAGKSTLYEVHPELFSNTERINADEVLKQSGGDWKNPNDNFKAMKEVLVKINTLIATKTSFHWETTLSGNFHSLEKLLKKLHRKDLR